MIPISDPETLKKMSDHQLIMYALAFLVPTFHPDDAGSILKRELERRYKRKPLEGYDGP